MRIYQVNDSINVTVIEMDVSEVGWKQDFFLSSDRHHDNVYADHVLERKHLEEAKETGAKILDFGDLYCAMQGKLDRRKDTRQLRPELIGENYIDLMKDFNREFYLPYKDQFVFLSPGNHESAVLKYNGNNLTQSLAEDLGCKFGTYAGWVVFKFNYHTTCWSVKLYYNHGYGGGGPVTKGTIQTNRMTAYIADADVVVTGHTHDQWVLPLKRTQLSQSLKPIVKTQWHVKCGGYKEEFLPGEGYHVEGGREPKPLGLVRMNFELRGRRSDDSTMPDMRTTFTMLQD